MSAKHDCINKINALLAPHNSELTQFFSIEDGPEKIGIMTSKVDEKKRGKPMLLFAKHCPMCGVKL